MTPNGRTLDRTCGECSACCKVLRVPYLEKPKNEWCPHCAISKGCRIYNERPTECEGYQCAWLVGYYRDEDRPDRSGVIASLEPTTDGKTAFTLREYRDGAAEKPRWQDRLRTVMDQKVVDRIAVFSPEGRVRRAWSKDFFGNYARRPAVEGKLD